MFTSDSLAVKIPTNEPPEEPISKEKLTDIPDPVAFADGQIYSEETLNKSQVTKGKNYSPVFNIQVEVKQGRISGKPAIKDLLNYTKELEECFYELKEKYEALLEKQKKEIVQSSLISDKKQVIEVKQSEFVRQTALAFKDQKQQQAANLIQRSYVRAKLSQTMDEYKKKWVPLQLKIQSGEKSFKEKHQKFQEECMQMINGHPIMAEAKQREAFQKNMQSKIAAWSGEQKNYEDEQATIQSEVAAIEKKFTPVMHAKYKKWLELNKKITCTRESLSDLVHIQVNNLQKDLYDGLNIFGGKRKAKKILEEKNKTPTRVPAPTPTPIEVKLNPELTPRLIEAVKDVNLKEVQKLLDQRADVNGLYGQETALHWAAFRKNLPIVELLLARGANPTLKNFRKKTPREDLSDYSGSIHATLLKAEQEYLQKEQQRPTIVTTHPSVTMHPNSIRMLYI